MTSRPNRVHVALIAVFLAVSPLAAAPAGPPAEVFSGVYDWRSGGRDDLRLEFEPNGNGSWRVTFRFDFDGRKYTWKGTAEGSLEDGSALTGTASSRSRKWTWDATLEEGVLRGRHREVRSRGRTYETGTFELER